MSSTDTFTSIAFMAATGHSISELATAIEVEGVYTWDRFGRFLQINAKTTNKEHISIRDKILDELSKGLVCDEQNIEYFEEALRTVNPLSESGWHVSKLPKFSDITKTWNKNFSGLDTPPLKVEIPKQCKIWEAFTGLIELKYGKDKLADLKSEHSQFASKVCDDLALKGISITTKTLKSYIKK